MFKLEFATDNAAFEGADGGREVARILREIAAKMEGHAEHGGYPFGKVRDLNGNTVGDWSLSA